MEAVSLNSDAQLISDTTTPGTNVRMKLWLASPIGAAFLLSMAHGLNDMYNGFLGALMPVLMQHFGFTLALAGVLAAIGNVSTSFFQPIFGYALDRSSKRPNMFIWPMITACAMCSIGFVPNVAVMVPVLVIAGLSTAAFHPHASSQVPSHTSSAGLAMALFISGGTVGFALGPLVSLSVVKVLGLRGLWVLVIPTALVCMLAMRAVPQSKVTASPGTAPRISLALDRDRIRAVGAIWLIVVLRSTVGTSFTAFMSVHLSQIGFPLVLIGVGLMLHTIAGAAGSIVGGWLSDRIGRKTVIILGLLGIMPAYLILIRSTGSLIWLMLPICGFLMSSFNPVTVVMAQQMFPHNRGAASGLIMGLGWSVGGFLLSVVGALADKFGLQTTLSWVTVLIVPALFIARTLPGSFMKKDVHPVSQ